MIDDLPHSRSIRVGALVVLLFAIAQRAPAAPTAGLLVCLAAAAGGWLVWTFRGAALPALLAIGVGGGLAAGYDAVAALFALLAAAIAGEELAPRRALGVAAAASAALGIAAAASDSGALAALALVVAPAGLVAGLARRQYMLRVEQAELRLAESQRTREEQARGAALAERVRIAREVHDVLAHSLSSLAIHLEVAEAQLERRDADGARATVQRARRLSADGLADARAAVAALRGDQRPLPERLGRLVDDHRAESGASATFTVTGAPRVLPPDAEAAFVRVAQEALTNVRRHAAGAPVRAALTFAPRETVLTVHDAAAPAPTATTAGYGLVGMRERAELLGGRLRAERAPDGWEVELRIPA
jgi:signal transduction histidine kinase